MKPKNDSIARPDIDALASGPPYGAFSRWSKDGKRVDADKLQAWDENLAATIAYIHRLEAEQKRLQRIEMAGRNVVEATDMPQCGNHRTSANRMLRAALDAEDDPR